MPMLPNPLDVQRTDTPLPVDLPPPRTTTYAPRLFIADDDDDVRETLAHLFACDGFDVTAVANGEALVTLLDEARRRGAEPDVLLLDHRMPCYTGLEVLAGLRTWGFTRPALLITAFGELTAEARALGADVIEKPFEPDTLRRRVFDLVGWANRTVGADDDADLAVALVVCASCGAQERLVDDDARNNPPTWFCVECRARARPARGDVIGDGD
ncbi:MAG: response regulator [Deltaproteobacteria bacterium]|nr:response regulator [Deltaproteobacteria bacterium]